MPQCETVNNPLLRGHRVIKRLSHNVSLFGHQVGVFGLCPVWTLTHTLKYTSHTNPLSLSFVSFTPRFGVCTVCGSVVIDLGYLKVAIQS